MKTLMLTLAGIAALATRAAAHDTTTPFPTRGACEAASAAMSNDERDVVLASFPELFDNRGDVSSFLTRAFTCDENAADGQWYITDHIDEVLASDWYTHRH